MEWHSVNAMTFESATHRVRRAGNAMWVAERKSPDQERVVKIGKIYLTMHEAREACELDAYERARHGE